MGIAYQTTINSYTPPFHQRLRHHFTNVAPRKRRDFWLDFTRPRKRRERSYGLLTIHTPTKDQRVTLQTFHFSLDSTSRGDDPGHLWRLYLRVQRIEERTFGSAHSSPVGDPHRSFRSLHPSRQSRTLHTLTAGPKSGVHFSQGVLRTLSAKV
jgi:hypothetical protein